MTCQKCGGHCHGRYCKVCGRDEHRNQALNPDKSQSEPDKQLYRCTQCGNEYESEGLGQCPECEGHRSRYIGDMEASA